MTKSDNIVAVKHRISPEQRWGVNGHRGGVVWFTGLPGSGKTTLALELEERLFRDGFQAYVLDGDNMRNGLCSDLGFSPDDRSENIRRVGEAAALLADVGIIAISAFISPYRSDRRRARETSGKSFHLVYLSADVSVCESRDPKGHYARARKGEIPSFTGVSAPYEQPEQPDLVIDTGAMSIEESADLLHDYINKNFRITDPASQT